MRLPNSMSRPMAWRLGQLARSSSCHRQAGRRQAGSARRDLALRLVAQQGDESGNCAEDAEQNAFQWVTISERERLVMNVSTRNAGLAQSGPGRGHHRLGAAQEHVALGDVGDEATELGRSEVIGGVAAGRPEQIVHADASPLCDPVDLVPSTRSVSTLAR